MKMPALFLVWAAAVQLAWNCPVTEEAFREMVRLEEEGSRLFSFERVRDEWMKAIAKHPVAADVDLRRTKLQDWQFHYDGDFFRLYYVYEQASGTPDPEGDAMITLRFRVEKKTVAGGAIRAKRPPVSQDSVLVSVELADVKAETGISWLP